MNKLIFITLSFLFVVLNGHYCPAANKDNLKEVLVHGKWVNKADGYIPNATGNSDRTVARYKIYQFNENGTFTMDSIKQRYTGTWELAGNTVTLLFNSKKITEFSPNLDPNASGQGYVTKDVMVTPGARTATVTPDMLKFSNSTQDAVHNSDAIAGMKNFWEFTGFANATWKT